MVKTILFDLGLTLVENDVPLQYEQFLKQCGKVVSLREVEKAYHLANKYFMREFPGKLGQPKETYLKEYLFCFCQFLGVPFLSQPLFLLASSQLQGQWKSFSFTKSTLAQLHHMGISTGLITNWDKSCRTLLAQLGLDTLLSPILVSSEEGYEKPSPQLFQKALSLCGVSAKDCLYVGDNYYDDAIGAKSVEMDCIIINKYGTLGIEELDHIPLIRSIQELPQWIQKNQKNEVQ